jgi:hypothetical protein
MSYVLEQVCLSAIRVRSLCYGLNGSALLPEGQYRFRLVIVTIIVPRLRTSTTYKVVEQHLDSKASSRAG